MTFEEIIDLVLKYLPAVLSFIAVIVSAFVCKDKTKRGITSNMLALLQKLPVFINDAEQKGFASGEAKFNYVFQLATIYLSSLCGKDTGAITTTYGEEISQAIEDILSTPQKHNI